MKNSRRTINVRQRLAKARRLLRKRIPPTVSLVDELISERREEARRESELRS